MPSVAYELGLALQVCGIFSIAALVERLRAEPATLAVLLDSDMTKAAVSAALVMVDASVQTETATAIVGTTTESLVLVRVSTAPQRG